LLLDVSLKKGSSLLGMASLNADPFGAGASDSAQSPSPLFRPCEEEQIQFLHTQAIVNTL